MSRILLLHTRTLTQNAVMQVSAAGLPNVNILNILSWIRSVILFVTIHVFSLRRGYSVQETKTKGKVLTKSTHKLFLTG